MANKLAGQRAKYSKALADYGRTEDEVRRQGAIRRMLEVVREAPDNNLSVSEVTGDRAIPGEVQRLLDAGVVSPPSLPEDPDQLVQELQAMVDLSSLQVAGTGDQFVYAYGYRCAPDRLKVGRTDGDVINRVTRQITTSTPDKPSVFLKFQTIDSRALEMTLHGILRLQGRKLVGGGDEWFRVTPDELLLIYRMVDGLSDR